MFTSPSSLSLSLSKPPAAPQPQKRATFDILFASLQSDRILFIEMNACTQIETPPIGLKGLFYFSSVREMEEWRIPSRDLRIIPGTCSSQSQSRPLVLEI